MQPEIEPVQQQTFLSWTLSALGFEYAILLALAAVLSFVLTLFVLVRGRGAMAGVALLLIVPAPLLIGIFLALQVVMNSSFIITVSPVSPRLSEVATAISAAFAPPLVGMLLMAPSYTLAFLGSVLRSFSSDPDRLQRR